MFCGNCGKQIPDDSTFCPECGAQIGENANPAAAPAAQPLAPSLPINKNKLIGIIAVAVAALLVIVLCVALLGGRSYEKTLDKYFDIMMMKGSGKDILSLFPNAMVEELLDDEDLTRAEYIEDLDDLIEEQKEYLEEDLEVEKYRVEYDIEEVDEYSNAELRDLNERLDDNYNFEADDAIDVEIEYTITVEIDGDEEEDEGTFYFTLIKVGRSWYFCDLYDMPF